MRMNPIGPFCQPIPATIPHNSMKRTNPETTEGNSKCQRPPLPWLIDDCLAVLLVYLGCKAKLRVRAVSRQWNTIVCTRPEPWRGAHVEATDAFPADLLPHVMPLVSSVNWGRSRFGGINNIHPTALIALSVQLKPPQLMPLRGKVYPTDWGLINGIIAKSASCLASLSFVYTSIGYGIDLRTIYDVPKLRRLRIPLGLASKWIQPSVPSKNAALRIASGAESWPQANGLSTFVPTEKSWDSLEHLRLDNVTGEVLLSVMLPWCFPKLERLTLTLNSDGDPGEMMGVLHLVQCLPRLLHLDISSIITTASSTWPQSRSGLNPKCKQVTSLAVAAWIPKWNDIFPNIKQLTIGGSDHLDIWNAVMPHSLTHLAVDSLSVSPHRAALRIEQLCQLQVVHSWFCNIRKLAIIAVDCPFARLISTHIVTRESREVREPWALIADETDKARCEMASSNSDEGRAIKNALAGAHARAVQLTSAHSECTHWRNFSELAGKDLNSSKCMPYLCPLLSMWLILEHGAATAYPDDWALPQ